MFVRLSPEDDSSRDRRVRLQHGRLELGTELTPHEITNGVDRGLVLVEDA